MATNEERNEALAIKTTTTTTRRSRAFFTRGDSFQRFSAAVASAAASVSHSFNHPTASASAGKLFKLSALLGCSSFPLKPHQAKMTLKKSDPLKLALKSLTLGRNFLSRDVAFFLYYQKILETISWKNWPYVQSFTELKSECDKEEIKQTISVSLTTLLSIMYHCHVAKVPCRRCFSILPKMETRLKLTPIFREIVP